MARAAVRSAARSRGRSTRSAPARASSSARAQVSPVCGKGAVPDPLAGPGQRSARSGRPTPAGSRADRAPRSWRPTAHEASRCGDRPTAGSRLPRRGEPSWAAASAAGHTTRHAASRCSGRLATCLQSTPVLGISSSEKRAWAMSGAAKAGVLPTPPAAAGAPGSTTTSAQAKRAVGAHHRRVPASWAWSVATMCRVVPAVSRASSRATFQFPDVRRGCWREQRLRDPGRRRQQSAVHDRGPAARHQPGGAPAHGLQQGQRAPDGAAAQTGTLPEITGPACPDPCPQALGEDRPPPRRMVRLSGLALGQPARLAPPAASAPQGPAQPRARARA